VGSEALQQDISDFRAQAHDDVGARLRNYRENANVGLRELARRIGVSASMISQIENGKSQPSVGTLYLIVSELGISLDELFSPDGDSAAGDGHRDGGDDEPEDGASRGPSHATPHPGEAEVASPVQHSGTRKAIKLAGGVRWERLTSQHDREVDFLHVVYDPGAASSDTHAHMRHSGKEYGIVLSGRLMVAVGFEEYELGSGDSISFDSTVPHRLWNPFGQPAHGIWVVIGRQPGQPTTGSPTGIDAHMGKHRIPHGHGQDITLTP
jgi:transcriptional regulator with XRE-family HTH domain